MLTPEEQAELAALEAEMNPQQQRQPAAPSRKPGDLTNLNIEVLSPEEAAELAALEQEFSSRQFQAPGPVEEKGILTQAGELIDSYTGAPVRQAIGTFQDTNSLRQAGGAFLDSFGEDPTMAPTGKEIAVKAGLSPESFLSFDVPTEGAQGRIVTKPGTDQPLMRQEVSPAGVAGLAIDMGADLTNLLPFAGVALKTTGKGAKTFLKGSAKAVDAAIGTPLVKVGDMTADAVKASSEAVKKAKVQISKAFRPDIASDFNELSEIAAKNGIDKNLLNEAVEFGENSVISRHARTVAEGPLGGDALQKHEQLVQAVSDATEKNIAKIGKTSAIADDVEAGVLIREAYDEGVDRFFNQMGETYGNALKMAPDLRLDQKSSKILSSKLNEMEMWAKKRMGVSADAEKVLNFPGSTKGQVTKATGEVLEVESSVNKAITKTQKQQAQEVLNAVKLAKNAMTSSGGDLRQVYQAMRDVGEIAFKSKNSLAEVPSDVRKFQELYFSLQKGATESIRSGLGDEFADALVKNNTEMSKFFTKNGNLAPIIGNKNLADEKVFHSLVMNGDSKKIDALFSIISPEAAGQLKASFLNKTLVRNPDGVINFASSRKKLNGLKQSGKLKTLLNDSEIIELDEILRLGDRAGIGVMSTSGTGASNQFRNMFATLQDKVTGDTLVDGLKKSARSNYVETTAKTADGVEYAKRIKAPEAAKKKSGVALLREASPVNKKQSAQLLKEKSIQERNERLQKYKQMRGL